MIRSGSFFSSRFSSLEFFFFLLFQSFQFYSKAILFVVVHPFILAFDHFHNKLINSSTYITLDASTAPHRLRVSTLILFASALTTDIALAISRTSTQPTVSRVPRVCAIYLLNSRPWILLNIRHKSFARFSAVVFELMFVFFSVFVLNTFLTLFLIFLPPCIPHKVYSTKGGIRNIPLFPWIASTVRAASESTAGRS